MEKLGLRELKKLDFLRSQDGRLISAASGLVKIGNTFYVIADDQLTLAVFTLNESSPGLLVPLVSGQLPLDDKARKKVKPDWEALVVLSATENQLTLLAVPSGSTMHRKLGVVVKLDHGKISATKHVDFSNLYQQLRTHFSELNIEGAAVNRNILKLFQRGNGKSAQNAIIDLDLSKVITEMSSSGTISSNCVINIKNYELGKLKSVNLSFTDACFCQDGSLFFLAAAESGESTYEDGEFLGSVLGRMDESGKVIWLKELDCPYKPEGLWVEKDRDIFNFFVVTDADDSSLVSSLYAGQITK